MSAHQDDEGSCNAQAFARLERARKTNAKCIEKQLAIQDEFRKMEKRKVELATLRKMNDGQREVWMQGLIKTTIIPYSKSWNRKMADLIQKNLPLEIRSMVYGYLMDKDTWNDFECPLHAITSVLPPEVGHCKCQITSEGMPRAPHFLYPEYMGSEAAAEVAKEIYTSEWFKEQTIYGMVHNLEALVHKDPFTTRFDPAPYIRSLDVVCHIDRYRMPPMLHCANDGNACRHNSDDRRYINDDKLRLDLSSLMDLLDKPNFYSLTVTFVQRNVRIDIIEEVLEIFADTNIESENAGADARIFWKYAPSTQNPTCRRHRKDVSDFFYEKRQIWKYRMRKFLNKLRPHMRKNHVRFSNEPNISLSDKEYCHRMWEDDEQAFASDEEDPDEEFDEDGEDSDSEGDSEVESGSNAIYWPDGRLYAE